MEPLWWKQPQPWLRSRLKNWRRLTLNMLAGASTPERVAQDRGAWLLLCLTGGVALLLYLASASGSRGMAGGPVLPLDDAYIPFQYARVLADGHPFQYNPDQPPTSGATSLLYPVILAAVYKLGFTGLQL